jgi:hypothetical protein
VEKVIPDIFSTQDNPEKAVIFQGCLPPHPAAGHFLNSLLWAEGTVFGA